MKAYQNIRFIDRPDIADIKTQGRKSSVGRIRRGESFTRFVDNRLDRPVFKVNRNDRGYCAPRAKAATRRYLKHVDRAIEARFEAAAEGVN